MENLEKFFDIAIIGLGPAGATFARLLDDNYTVIAFDKKNTSPKSFKKPCGGLLAEDSQKILAKMDLALPKEVISSPLVFNIKTIDLETKNVKNFHRTYININRENFDLWLKTLIKSNTIINNEICTKIEKHKDVYKITTNKNSSYYAKYIIGADGANSIVRKTLYPNKKLCSYLAIQEWFIDEHAAPFSSCLFDQTLTNSYCWGLSKDTKFIIGGAFPIKTARINFKTLKQKVKQFGFRLNKPIKIESCLVLCPTTPFDFCCGKDNCFLIGEAAGFISPSSLEGISYAMKSAEILSNLFNTENVSNKNYKKHTLKLRQNFV